jgi:EmrB/QacA subfamily drug resistance transporter
MTTPVRTGRHANTSLVVLFLSLGGLAFAVLQSLVAPALPVIGHELHTTTENIAWVLTAYLLAASVFTPILGRLGDIVGKRKVLLAVLIVLAAGTLLAALSPNLPVLIIARVLQGAAGAIFPLAIGIVRDELPRERVGVTVGLLSAIFGVGGGLGIVLAGPIVAHFSWPWLFWFPLMLIGIALIGVIFGVPESPVRTPGRLDLIGTVILSVSKGRDWGWADGKTLGLIALGAVALVVFVLVELRVKDPLINMRLIALRGVWTTNLVGLTFGFAMYGSFLLLPTLLELPAATGYGFGKTVTTAGLFLLPSTLMMMVFGPVSGILERRYGPKLPLIIGAILETAAFALPAFAHHTTWQLLTSGFLSGAGLGFAFAAMSNAIIESVPASHTGEATSVNTIVRSIGGSVGSAVVAAVLTGQVTAQGIPTDHAFSAGFGVSAAVAALAVVASFLLPRRRREQIADDLVTAGDSAAPSGVRA